MKKRNNIGRNSTDGGIVDAIIIFIIPCEVTGAPKREKPLMPLCNPLQIYVLPQMYD
jgi:hypothetical protein